MKTVKLTELGIDNLSIVESELPEIKPNEVLVNIKAVSLNYLDLILADGSFGADLPMPYTPASDGAGVVEAAGDEVTEWSIGDRVLIHYMPKWQSGNLDEEANSVRVGLQTQGVLSEYVTFPEYGLVKAPDNLTLDEGATLPIAAITAWEGLIN
ncbi:MAG: alcohol dehydrogenase catalytic domain-containing protein [Balneolaceae bacterium]|nr:alcohol dehydrogenase catalytic domain-containing protein [Balneolaceae bacterium]